MTHQPPGQPCYCNEAGWMDGVEHIPITWGLPLSIANHQGELEPAVVVDHIMQGYLHTMVDWARTGASKVIVHFGIGRNGRTVQFHRADTKGIHASGFNHKSPDVARRVKQRATSPNNYSVGIEHEGCSVDPRPDYSVPASLIYSEDNPWPEAMVQASIRVHRWLFANLPTLGKPSADSIIGHYQTGDPNRVNDPAAADDRDVWPRDRIIAAIAPVQLTAEQQYVVDAIRANRASLTDAEVAAALAEVGLDAMPGEGSADSSPSSEAPKSAPAFDREAALGLIAANERALEQAESLVKASRDRLTDLRRRVEA